MTHRATLTDTQTHLWQSDTLTHTHTQEGRTNVTDLLLLLHLYYLFFYSVLLLKVKSDPSRSPSFPPDLPPSLPVVSTFMHIPVPRGSHFLLSFSCIPLTDPVLLDVSSSSTLPCVRPSHPFTNRYTPLDHFLYNIIITLPQSHLSYLPHFSYPLSLIPLLTIALPATVSHPPLPTSPLTLHLSLPSSLHLSVQIGRASWRERV